MMFGKPVRSKYFSLLDGDVLPINHGSYGLTPVPVFDKFLDLVKQDYAFPDKYMIETQSNDYEDAIKVVGDIVACDYHNIAIIDNATTGINTIVRSKNWQPTDKVLVTSVVYDSCEYALQYLAKVFGFEIIKMTIDVDGDVLEQFKQKINDNPGITACMFDLVSSMPAFLFPYKQLVSYFKQQNIISIIDGAHGVGLVPLNLGELDPDYFVSNLHKWYYVPRPCAFMYVSRKHFQEIQPLPISHVYITESSDDDILVKKFKFLASKNYAYLKCIKTAKEFRDQWGDEKIWSYCKSLNEQVTEWLTQRWGTVQVGTKGLQMSNIIIPSKYNIPRQSIDDFKIESSHAKRFFQVGYYKDSFVIRLSFQIYNEFDDYKKSIEDMEPMLLEFQQKLNSQ